MTLDQVLKALEAQEITYLEAAAKINPDWIDFESKWDFNEIEVSEVK